MNRVAKFDAISRLTAGEFALSGGVAWLNQFPDAAACRELTVEAWEAYREASRQEHREASEEEWRGGKPPRALASASGGQVQDALYAAPWLHDFLSQMCGVRITPSGNRGSYSYYVNQGDFLDIHLDVDGCDVTLITVLYDDTDPTSEAGGLCVYRQHVGVPLSAVRSAPDLHREVIKPSAGQSVLLLGGFVPHAILPMEQGQRVISALCFRATL